ncbi:hypothetical protein PZE02_003439 [Salmonella enterica subsp. enterica serovar Vitkin]|uniref:Uncharacterized protein n=3 Tax=Salmonella enterica TaxID=28901 RepID=A0A5Z6P8S8_SALET|nr:hypothetical protein [Salmonella enterica]EBG5369746.1 hypothetical protein [Salmonella enterica subsp. enterica serovar Monschaui]EBH8281031.1 hypothetical protein [Salmonella enterica subsp. enterica serovar Typhimurium str. UK-1]EBP3975252.1 hypothetical protein [Salmonella enterica subsp. enterica]EBS2690419.1 hypothetical protein [Salmonella enterica subsp. enterica serovar Muenchen]EBV4408307.1 hypothetical protein [Salmonella enterica subsp. enterica serovar Baildon]EBY0128652.1 hyp
MYEYSDVFDECENGGPDGGPVIFTRNQVIRILKQHGHKTPKQWMEFFREEKLTLVSAYPAAAVYRWLNY